MPVAGDAYEKDDATTLAHVKRCHEASKLAYSVLRETYWRRAHMLYHNKHDLSMFRTPIKSGQYPYESDIFVPATWSQVEAMMPRIMGGLFNCDPPARATPIVKDGRKEVRHRLNGYAKSVSAFVHQQTHDLSRLYLPRALQPWARQSLITGFLPLFVEWERKSGLRFKQEPDGRGAWKFTPQPDVVEEGIRVSACSPMEFFPDPWGESINGEDGTRPCGYVQRRLWPHKDEVRAWMEGAPNRKWHIKPDDLEKYAVAVVTDSTGHRKILADSGMLDPSQGNQTGSVVTDKSVIPLLEHWGRDRYVLAIHGGAGGGAIVLDEKGADHPYPGMGIPVVILQPMPLYGSLIGVSPVLTTASMQHQINCLVNLRNVNLFRRVNGTTLIHPFSGINADQYMLMPSKVYQTSGAIALDECLKQIDHPDVTSKVYDEVGYAHQQFNMAWGQGEVMQGVNPKGFDDSVRGMQMLVASGTAQSSLKVSAYAYQLSRLLQLIYEIDCRRVTKDSWASVMGDEGAEYIPFDPMLLGPVTDDKTGKVLGAGYAMHWECKPDLATGSELVQQLLTLMQIAGPSGALSQGAAILRIATAMKIDNPRELLTVQPQDAEAENALFMARGTFPPVHADDNDMGHIGSHKELLTPQMPEAMIRALAAHIFDHDKQLTVKRHPSQQQQAEAEEPAGEPAGMEAEAPPEGAPPEGAPPEEPPTDQMPVEEAPVA